MGRNVSNTSATKHKEVFKRREIKKTPLLTQDDVGAKNIKMLRNRIVYKKSSNVVLIGLQVLMFLVILNYYVDISEAASEQIWRPDDVHLRDPRRMFGGYRITPRFCTPTLKTVDKKKGPSICMFNHECTQRNGVVVGACMDGFLFGACCQIAGTPGVIKDSVETGVVTVLDQMKTGSNDFDLTPSGIKIPQFTNSISEKTNIYPIRTSENKYSTPPIKLSTTQYYSSSVDDGKFVEVSSHHVENPSTLAVSMNHIPSSTEKMIHDFTSSGVAQIANMLQGSPAKEDLVTMISNTNPDSNLFSYSTISHDKPDTILFNKNGSAVSEVSRPVDFVAPGQNIQVSTMQTKPSMVTSLYSRTPPSTTTSTLLKKPQYQKPIFKPKPAKPNQDKFVLVQTVVKPEAQGTPPTGASSAIGSIETIMNMLNESHPSTITNDDLATATSTEAYKPENRITTIEVGQSTVSPLSYSSGYPITYDEYDYVSTIKPFTGHYITTAVNKLTTFNPPSTSYVSSSTPTRRPGYTASTTGYGGSTATYSDSTSGYSGSTSGYSGSTSKYPDKYGSTSFFYTKKPVNFIHKDKLEGLQQIENNLVSSTLSYDEYWGSNVQTSPSSNKKPPSTSYVYSPVPSKRPISVVPNINYDLSNSNLDSFSSVTPTVIVLSSPDSHEYSQTPSPIPDKQPVKSQLPDKQEFVQILLKPPHKKPPNLITINNFITSNNMISLGQNQGKPTSEKPSPTVLITPKPSTVTTTVVSGNYSPINVRPAVSVISETDNYPTSKPSYKPSKKPTTYVISTTVSKRPGTKPTSTPIWRPVQSASPTTPSYPQTTLKNEVLTSPDDLINFPPVRNPNLNATGSNQGFYNNSVSVDVDDIVLQEVEFTTPAFLQEDDELNLKMNLFVNKIVGSLQGTFQELHDIVILDKPPNATVLSDSKPTKKPGGTTRRPTVTTTTKRPQKTQSTATTKKPTTTKKPPRSTTAKATTTTTTTKKTTKATSPTKKPRPTKSKTTTPAPPNTEVLNAETAFTTETPDGDYKHLCGVRPMVKSGRIVGGKASTFGEWPWQVLVRESTWLGLFTKNKCGGVLITTRYVTTAAHCQPGFLASLVAVFGEFDISGELEGKRSVSKNVRRVIVHRQYDAATFENDLALLELESPVHYDTHIVPICMPSDEADFTGRMATVTGWGRLKYGGGVPSVLQEVKVPIMENSVCQEMFNTAGHAKVILNSFLCAGYANGQKDSCEGDSGGPLVLQRSDGRWELAGTVSHGIKCAAPYLPGVYMRTTYYKPWLRSITGVN